MSKTAQKPIREIMANERYCRVTLADHHDPEKTWGPQHVGVNGYAVFIPRGEKVLVAESILKQLYHAGETRGEISPREHGWVSPGEAHEARLAGEKVYPTRAPAPELEPKKKPGRPKAE